MKRNKDGFIGFSMIGFLIFFLTVIVSSTMSITVYYLINKYSKGNTLLVGIAVLITILIISIIFTWIDILRRKRMIDAPVKKILDATQKIASGDFSVKLEPNHDYIKYDSYDLIYENINIMTAELSKNEVLKNDFISNVSHEIKTPLAVIQNYAQVLKQNNIPEEQKQEYLNGLVLQTNKLSSLVSNILKLNKLENQKIVPEFSEFDISELLRITTLSFENLFEKKNLNLVCEIEDATITSAPSLLEIVFNNLISNAIKFTNNGGSVFISLKNTQSHVEIQVKDTGCGISKEVGRHIFDKFYQGDPSHSSEGNGLGLALVKNVIDVIGGEISVESKVGIGTSFKITLKKEQ